MSFRFFIADENNEVAADAYIPTKASLPRGSAHRNSSKRKVPPIALGTGKARGDEGGVDTARDSVLNEIYDDDSATDEVRATFYSNNFATFPRKYSARDQLRRCLKLFSCRLGEERSHESRCEFSRSDLLWRLFVYIATSAPTSPCISRLVSLSPHTHSYVWRL